MDRRIPEAMSFELHPQLARDTLPVARLRVSELLLMNDARFPWCILVPRIAGLTEWHHLTEASLAGVTAEIHAVSLVLEALPGITKLNVGALGNRVSQLHIHVLGRHPDDAAWPGPVWGQGTARPYAPGAADELLARLRNGVGRIR
jgi:diadenosine tetraphosphate (Ap4A) HIT family hydrolase